MKQGIIQNFDGYTYKEPDIDADELHGPVTYGNPME